MPVYHVIRKADGEQVYGYGHDFALDLDMFPFSDYDHIPVAEPEPPVQTMFGGRRRLTKLEFVALLGQAAYVAILAMAKQSIEVEAWVKMLELATPEEDGSSVNLDDPRTQAGIVGIGGALGQAGVVGADWAQGVLNG